MAFQQPLISRWSLPEDESLDWLAAGIGTGTRSHESQRIAAADHDGNRDKRCIARRIHTVAVCFVRSGDKAVRAAH